MRIDKTDITIFTLLTKNKKLTSSSIANRVFHPKNSQELTKYNSMIYYRLQNWVGCKIIREKEKKGKKYYFLDTENIVFGNGYISIKPLGSRRSMRLFFTKMFTFVDDNVCYTVSQESPHPSGVR